MKVIELIIDAIDEFTGVDAVALVEEPAIQADFFAFNDKEIQDAIAFNLIKEAVKDLFVERRAGETKEQYISRCIPVLKSEGFPEDQAAAICYESFKFDETEDILEIDIYGYKTRHYDMCPGATSLYEAILRGDHGDIDQDLVIRAAKLQDSLFYLEKHVLDMGTATQEDVISAQNLADEIYILADMMNLREQHSYIDGHVAKIKEVAGVELDIDVSGLPSYVNEISSSYEFESYTDYPESATNAAKRALEWRDSHPDTDCGTRVGWARANQLANRRPISEETIARMASFARHLQHEDVPYSEGCGGLMVDAWGGRAGINWAQSKLDEIREEQSLSKFSFALQEDQQMVVGPLMLPKKLILRVDEQGEPYYIFFSEETIKEIAHKVMRTNQMHSLNIEHNPEDKVDGYMVSTWLVEDPLKDKQQLYGFNFPKGTWMGEYKIEDKEVWNKVKAGEVKGFSVEGLFNDKFIQASKNI